MYLYTKLRIFISERSKSEVINQGHSKVIGLYRKYMDGYGSKFVCKYLQGYELYLEG